jgi:hypothetical protein
VTEPRLTRQARDLWAEFGDGSSLYYALRVAMQFEYTLPDGSLAYPDAETFRYVPGHVDLELVFVVQRNRVVAVAPPRKLATVSPALPTC